MSIPNMLKTAVKSLGVMFLAWTACVPVLLIPGVHFLLIVIVPLVPFVVSYRQAQKTSTQANSVGMDGLTFGFVIGVAILLGLIILLVLGNQLDWYKFEGRTRAIVWIVVLIAPLYSGSMSALGFMYGILKKAKSEGN